MKTNTRNCWIRLAVAATLMGRLAVHAQDWKTVDDFALTGGDAEARGVATDAAGGIYVVGTADGHGIVRYSPDDGLNWITRHDFAFDSTNYTLFNAVTVDSQGTVFVGGTGGGHWLVRRSTDQGVTWETVDDYWRPRIPPEPGTNGVVYTLSSDGQGRVYGAGPLIKTHCPCYNTWWVRGSSVGGTNWDSKLVLFSGYGGINQATCAGEDVYATGTADGGGEGNTRLLLRSSDHGASWSTVFQATNDVHNVITTDLATNFYFAGASWNSNSIMWLLLRAAPGGTNWTTLDGSSYAEEPPVTQGQPYGAYIQVSSIAVDAAGNAAVTGRLIVYWVVSIPNGATYGADWTWVTGQYSAATGQWSTTDQFAYSAYGQDNASGTTFAPSGSVFTVGYVTSNSGQRRWIVRKRAVPLPSANFSANPTSGNAPLTVQFTDQSTGAITTWDWSFGDGSADSSERNPSHIYTNAGNYTVTLTVGGSGGSNSKNMSITVTVPTGQGGATPQDQVETLISMVKALIRQGPLNRGQGKQLLAPLQAAEDALNAGRHASACDAMSAFVNEVRVGKQRGKLTLNRAQSLTDTANALKSAIGCPEVQPSPNSGLGHAGSGFLLLPGPLGL